MKMKILKSILTLFVFYSLFNSAQGLRDKKRKTSSNWLFERFGFDWSYTTFTLYNDNAESKDKPLKSKFHKWGIYFDSFDSSFLSEYVLYKHETETGNNTVIDFVYVKDCHFNLAQNRNIFHLNFIIQIYYSKNSIPIAFNMTLPHSYMTKELDYIKEINSTLKDACLQRKKELEEEAKKIVIQQAKQKIIADVFYERMQMQKQIQEEELKKIENEKDKQKKGKLVQDYLAIIASNNRDKINLAQTNALKNGKDVLYARLLTYGPKLVIDCPSLNPSLYPFELKLKFDKHPLRLRQEKIYGHNIFNSFYTDFEKKQYKLAIRGGFFPTKSKVQFVATYPGNINCISEPVNISERSFEDNILIYRQEGESGLIFKDCGDLCGPKKVFELFTNKI